ncbi:MAG: prolyl-tRNA synthetase [Candidatus Liptonbacteria bacterium RIFCSPLOWO2_01_FULL_56_20]|uniref:Proline--tRNA ligase n=1 Tax=Candidatus Liptonbacteria bacterium RIFCSPLOWO2_01_FULL_56_20 TaxID=1798652 RepID=A0A1G2CK84_9BACT|nr:MAG: prolyl-tRNA synthetase [Candidatus Liptonbacteria bacterium RIFCSPHIGHO2_01_FULL_56_18b]OGZ01814.1 MAG: prolyl-tRNA synthetase [Candidatus Liptonbacteria bacterium RIFCSPLOWO2_01_FULL_56_20]
MLQSKLFTKTLRNPPKDEAALNARLLIRAGFIHKVMAGVYEYLPLGFRVIEKIKQIIREEMDAIGGQEIALSALQDKSVWEKSGRWDDNVLDIWFKTKLKNDSESGFATTHEEPLTFLMKNYIASYRDLPVYTYQFQTKFRNELRAKSGLLRCREFLMKDLYSFCRTREEHEAFYEKAKQAYHKVFERVGLGDITFFTFASGSSFSKYSHEFQTLAEVGEDTVYLDRKRKLAVNKEVMGEEALQELGLREKDLEEVRAIEVGNIFPLGTKFSDAFDLVYLDEAGEKHKVIMGSYGIGLGRLMGALVEVFHDKDGIMWPEAVAPFAAHLLELEGASAEKLYRDLQAQGVEVLYDERKTSAGEKFHDADLLGLPWRLVVSPKTQGKIEVKKRSEKNTTLMSQSEVVKLFMSKKN